jgi:hypothetical protein
MEANGGKISNWSGILMAATPGLGEYEALQSTAEMVEKYGDYASPWLNMAEKAINGDTIRSEDYLMAVGNTLSTAIDTNTSYLGDTLSKIAAKTTVAGAMYLGDKETANTYFNEMVGQEVGSFLSGFAGDQMQGMNGVAATAVTAGISSYASTFVSNRMGGMSARDSFAEAYSGLGQSMNDAVTGSMAKTSRATAARADIFGMAMDAATNTQRMDFGTIKNLQIVDELNDGEDKAYGAFDSATGKVMVSRDLINKAQSGDQGAAAHLLGLLKEELSHREAQAAEQALNIKDYPFDEGALAARQMLQALGEHDGRTAFTFNANDEGFDFETSADAINKAVDDKFGWGRILSDRQSGSLEFNSGSVAGLDHFGDLGDLNSKMDSLIAGDASLQEVMAVLDAQAEAYEGSSEQSYNELISLYNLSTAGGDAKEIQAAINAFNGLSEGDEGALAVDGAFGKGSKAALQAALFSDRAMSGFDWKRDSDLQGYQNDLYDLGGSRSSSNVMLMQSMLVSEDRNGALAGYMNGGVNGVGVGNFGNVTKAAYTASRRNDPELAAIYSAQGLTNTGGDTRQLQVTRDGRTIDFNVRDDATDKAQTAGYSVNQALANTSPDTYKSMVNASFETKNVTSLMITGAWRPSGGSNAHPSGQGLDIGSISTANGTDSFFAKSRNGLGAAVATESSVISEFTNTLYNQGSVSQTITPWKLGYTDSGLSANLGIGKTDREHFNHLHFTSRN